MLITFAWVVGWCCGSSGLSISVIAGLGGDLWVALVIGGLGCFCSLTFARLERIYG
jgi:hypothetical protein